jgi:alanine racemase
VNPAPETPHRVLPDHPGLASWLEISAGALRHNLGVLRDLVGEGPCVGAVVKGNAYGHGLAEVLPVVHPEVDVLYVITAQDALRIRALEAEGGLARRQTIVLGAISPEEAVCLAEAGIDAVLGGDDWSAHLFALRDAGATLRVHVHVDTGLGREGYGPNELDAAIALLNGASDVLEPIGVCSHFANTEDVTEQAYAVAQLDGFDEACGRLSAALGRALERHVAASAAAMVLPRSRFDVVRLGIALYGLWPSPETRLSARVVHGDLPHLEPALAWRCRPQLVKWLKAGSYVGYGCTWRAPRDTRIGVLPVGYFDGYPRLLSGKAHVLVGGARCPVLGRVMMNHLVVDLTGLPEGDPAPVATLLGPDDGEVLAAELLAGWAQTIHYEIVARLGPHLKRVVV